MSGSDPPNLYGSGTPASLGRVLDWFLGQRVHCFSGHARFWFPASVTTARYRRSREADRSYGGRQHGGGDRRGTGGRSLSIRSDPIYCVAHPACPREGSRGDRVVKLVWIGPILLALTVIATVWLLNDVVGHRQQAPPSPAHAPAPAPASTRWPDPGWREPPWGPVSPVPTNSPGVSVPPVYPSTTGSPASGTGASAYHLKSN